jgi:hypothetical protein
LLALNSFDYLLRTVWVKPDTPAVSLFNVTDLEAVKGQLKGKADTFPHGSEKNKKATKNPISTGDYQT